jgi:hypothetical protein
MDPPEHPGSAWLSDLIATDNAGEAYFIADMDLWGDPWTTRISIYHIQNYGALVDSSYFELISYHLGFINHSEISDQWELKTYPNPFNPKTTISFSLPRAGRVELSVYDVTGRKTGGLLSAPTGVIAAGEYRVEFDGRDLPSGIYFVWLNAGGISQTQKIVLLK